MDSADTSPEFSIEQRSPEPDSGEVIPAKLFDLLYSPADRDQDRSSLETVKSPGLARPLTSVAPVEAEADVILEQFTRVLQRAKKLTQTQRKALFDQMVERLEGQRSALEDEVGPLPSEGYPCYRQAESGTDPYQWLRNNWGQWLRHFNPNLSRDYLFLDQLGELDPELKNALYAKRRSILSRTGLAISEIVPKKSVRLDMELAQLDPSELKRAVSAYVRPRIRKHRARR